MKPLKTVYTVTPFGTLSRTQKPNETIVTGKNGHYFIKRCQSSKYSRWWEYEYFGLHEYNFITDMGYKNGISLMNKRDITLRLKNDLNSDERLQLKLDLKTV